MRSQFCQIYITLTLKFNDEIFCQSCIFFTPDFIRKVKIGFFFQSGQRLCSFLEKYFRSKPKNYILNKLNAIARMSPFLKIQQRLKILNAFFCSQFKYCPLVWMFHSRYLGKKLIVWFS